MDYSMISPRKRMAMGASPAGSAMKHPGTAAATHVPPATGTSPELSDSARGIRPNGHMERQPHPDHGPMADHFQRGGKV
jgi:hypothetical protein